MPWLSEISAVARRFLSDDSGTAGLEFVCASPLLIGVLIFTAEYGQALRARMTLDRATQDAARFLARAPADNGGQVNGNPTIALYGKFVNDARTMVEERVDGGVTFSATTFTVDSANFREPYYVVRVDTSVVVNLPLLSFFNIFHEDVGDGNSLQENGENSITGAAPLQLQLSAAQTVRWSNGSPPGEASCTLSNRYQGLCP